MFNLHTYFSKVLLPDGRPVPCVLLGNKSDQEPSESRFTDDETMETLAKEKGFAGFFPTSARDNINVEEAAKFLVQKIVDNDKWNGRLKSIYDHSDGIDLAAYRNSRMELKSADKKCNC